MSTSMGKLPNPNATPLTEKVMHKCYILVKVSIIVYVKVEGRECYDPSIYNKKLMRNIVNSCFDGKLSKLHFLLFIHSITKAFIKPFA